MRVAAAPSGTSKDATAESILQSELNKLQEGRDRFKAANQKYIANHPELRTILDDFMSNVVENKPSDILKFAVSYFQGLRTGGGSGYPCLVVTGPAGVGKSTLIKLLVERNRDAFAFPVEHTTRPPKAGESNGVHFHFISVDEFNAMNGTGEFIGARQVQQTMYGTSVKAIEKERARGKICILDVSMDVQQQVRLSPLECKYLFISPKSIDALEERLKKAQKDNEVTIRRKVDEALEFLAVATEDGAFDETVVNDKLEDSYRELVFALLTFYPKCQGITIPETKVAEAKSGGAEAKDAKK